MFRAKEIWAFMSVDQDDDEGLIGVMRDGAWLPFVATDLTRVDLLREMAKQVATETNQKVNVVRFTVRENMEEILPEEQHKKPLDQMSVVH